MMRARYLIALSLLVGAAAQAQSVKSGIEAWGHGDYAGALVAWRPLAAKGDADAMFNLGQAYRLGKGTPIDLGQAIRWYTDAAEKGHVDAQTELGILLFRNGNQLSALRWLRAAAEKGEPRAQLLYGTALFNGDGLVKRDPQAAYAFVARAAAQGLAPANATLAEMDGLMPLEVRQKALAGVAASPARAKLAAAPRPATPNQRPAPHLPTTAAKVTPPPMQRPESVATGSWRVQLGAFGQRSAAEALFRKLAAGPLAGRQPVFVPVGAMTRLQAGPFASKAAAAAVCSALNARGQACFAVPAR